MANRPSARTARRRLRAPLIVPLIVAAWCGHAGAARAEDASGTAARAATSTRANFEYRSSPDSVVLRYVETPTAYVAADAGRSVVVYGDGRVVVHYPALMTRAGEYTLQLSASEMRQLVARVVERNFVDLDETEARRVLRPGSRSRLAETPETREFFAVFDEATSTIELNLASYRPAGSRAAARRDVKRSIRFYALRAHARRYRDNPALQDLAAVEQELLGLLERQDLERVK